MVSRSHSPRRTRVTYVRNGTRVSYLRPVGGKKSPASCKSSPKRKSKSQSPRKSKSPKRVVRKSKSPKRVVRKSKSPKRVVRKSKSPVRRVAKRSPRRGVFLPVRYIDSSEKNKYKTLIDKYIDRRNHELRRGADKKAFMAALISRVFVPMGLRTGVSR